MARIRTIKPELFRHESLFDLEIETKLPIRFAWAGLFTICDREGRFKWRPRSIKAEILPYDDLDFSRVLHALATRGLIVRYALATGDLGETYGVIPTFRKHQVINNKEGASILPDPSSSLCVVFSNSDDLSTRASRVLHAYPEVLFPDRAEGKGRERKGKERNLLPGIRKAYSEEFEDIWKQYGNHGDKGEAYDVYEQLKLSPEEVAQLRKAIENTKKEKSENQQNLFSNFSKFLITDWREKLHLIPHQSSRKGIEEILQSEAQ